MARVEHVPLCTRAVGQIGSLLRLFDVGTSTRGPGFKSMMTRWWRDNLRWCKLWQRARQHHGGILAWVQRHGRYWLPDDQGRQVWSPWLDSTQPRQHAAAEADDIAAGGTNPFIGFSSGVFNVGNDVDIQ